MHTAAIACPHCASACDGGARFCTQCGGALGGPAVPQAPAAPVNPYYSIGCATCGGDGSRLEAQRVYCPTCRWLRPIGPGYDLPVEAFMWRLDADAMRTLSGIGPLNAAAHSISEQVGRPWFEA
ncbi:MAG: hypothetical protein JNK94_06570, partial [Hyphomonadaceae bacterium]|nr:hypothetical protein [Hyphomonadaceae bacterium]